MKTNQRFPRSSGSVIGSLTLSAVCTLAVLTACQPKARNQDQPAAAAAEKPADAPTPSASPSEGTPHETDAELAETAGQGQQAESAPAPSASAVPVDAGSQNPSGATEEKVASEAKPTEAKPPQASAPSAAVPAESVTTQAANCLVQLFRTEMPLPDDVFEKTKGKSLCLEDYFAAKQVHRFSFDFDKMKLFEDPNGLKAYDRAIFHLATSSPLASKKLEESDRVALARGIWETLLASMKIEAAPCKMEINDGETPLDLAAVAPVEKVDQETGNVGTRLMIDSTTLKAPSWKLTCPSFTKKGKYFFLFVDVYENSKAGDAKNPDRMLKYLFSAN